MNALVVIPAYNEERNIRKVLSEFVGVHSFVDVVVINDGSSDATEQHAREFPVYVLSHPCNLGYGAALQSGFRFAEQKGYTHIVQFDSDGQHNPSDISVILNEFFKSDADVVIGSRYLGDAGFYPGWAKRVAVVLFQIIIRITTGKLVTDPTSGIRGLSRSVFSYYAVRDRFPSDFPDADIVIEMLLHGYHVREVPVGHRDRDQGTSMHSGLKPVVYILKVLISILSILLNFLFRKRGAR